MHSAPPDANAQSEDNIRGSKRRQSRLLLLKLGLLSILAVVAVAVNLSYFKSNPVRQHVRQGIAFADAGKPREAEKEWRAALRSDPSHVEPYLLLSRLYLNVDQPEEAIPLLERLKKISPKSEHVLCSLADAYTRTGKTKEGLEAARQAVIVEPNCANAHALLGIHLGDGEDTRGALAELSKACALAPNDDKIAISYAQAQLDANDYPGAERTARSVIARNPKYATAWYSLGRAYSRRDPTPENLKTAIDAFQRATELNPLFGDAFAEIGRLRVAAGDYQGAIAALEHVWNRGVHNKETAYNLSNAYRKIGDQKSADKFGAEFKRLSDFHTQYEALQKNLSVEPNNTEVAFKLAQLEIDSGDLENALPLMQGVLQRRPRDQRVLTAAVKLYDLLHQPQLSNAFRERLTSVRKEEKEAISGN